MLRSEREKMRHRCVAVQWDKSPDGRAANSTGNGHGAAELANAGLHSRDADPKRRRGRGGLRSFAWHAFAVVAHPQMQTGWVPPEGH